MKKKDLLYFYFILIKNNFSIDTFYLQNLNIESPKSQSSKNYDCFSEKNLTEEFLKKCQPVHVVEESVKCHSEIKIINEHSATYPNRKERSELLRFKAITNTINCNVSSAINKYWKLINRNEKKEIFLFKNPTNFSDELTILSNSLNYGLHEITFFIEFWDNNSKYSFNSSTFVNIVPSGILVNGIENQNNLIKIGTNQKLEFVPINYSFDIDQLIESSQLNFSFYCKLIQIDSDIIESSYLDQKLIDDFYRLKNENATSPCFESSSIIIKKYHFLFNAFV